MAVAYERVTEISCSSSPDYLPRLRKIIACIAAGAGMDTQEIQDAKLALNEACTNAIRHGSPRGQDSNIKIRLRALDRTVVTEVTDEGTGFDPTTLPQRDKTKLGGLGIPLMKALSDDVEFEKNGQGMTVRLVKRARKTRTFTRRRFSNRV